MLNLAQKMPHLETLLAKVPVINALLDLKPQYINRLPRVIYHNVPKPANYKVPKYETSYVRTTKYTVINFLPKNLLLQCRMAANLFFIAIAILVSFEIFDQKDPELQIVPIVAFVSIIAVKDGIEDFLRYRKDQSVNNRYTHTIKSTGEVQRTKWKNLKVGDIVEVLIGEIVPADILLLNESCAITTSQLDGESGLKPKRPPCGGIKEPSKAEFIVDLAGANAKLDDFGWSLFLGGRTYPISYENFLPRGSILATANSSAIGIACYTGVGTKAELNTRGVPSKRSKFSVELNWYMLFCFALLCGLCIISAGVNSINLKEPGTSRSVFESGVYHQSSSYLGFISFLCGLILMQNMVPISLYIMTEISRSFQVYFIASDIELYDPVREQRCIPHAWGLCDELGMIDNIFTDKTGTLTQNKMTVSKLYSRGVLASHETGYMPDLRESILCLSVCHTVIPSSAGVYDNGNPDELALVSYAAKHGFVVNECSLTTRKLDIAGTEITYEIIAQVPFSSERGMMSIVIKDPASGDAILYCKGADDKILSKLSPSSEFVQETVNHVADFARQGLRTLMLAYRRLDAGYVCDWERRYMEASKEGTQSTIEAELESDLVLLGATGVRDLIQEGAYDTVTSLMKAGIRFWMLTGDKAETTKSVAQECGLIPMSCEQLILSSTEDLVDLEERKKSDNISLIVQGEAISTLLEDRRLIERFFALSATTASVICSRASPKEKAEILRYFKEYNKDATTLAIGDGGNDVPMLHTAHVGVGIIGQEGLAAEQNSDFAIAKFRYLKRLLLVHGRWNHYRLSKMTAYLLYQNVMFPLNLFWYGIFDHFDGTYFWDEIFMTLFNLFYTSLPLIAIGSFSQDISAVTAMAHPKLYRDRKSVFDWQTLISFFVDATYQSGVTFVFGILPFLGGNFVSPTGRPANFRESLGNFVVFPVVIVCNLFILIQESIIDIVLLGCVIFSFLLLFLVSLGDSEASVADAESFYHSATIDYQNPSFWAVMLLSSVVALLPRFVWTASRRIADKSTTKEYKLRQIITSEQYFNEEPSAKVIAQANTNVV